MDLNVGAMIGAMINQVWLEQKKMQFWFHVGRKGISLKKDIQVKKHLINDF